MTRLGLWAVAVLLGAGLPSVAAERGVAIHGGRLRASQVGAATVLAITRGGRTARVTLPEDTLIVAGSLDAMQVVGGIDGRVVIVTTDYLSRPKGPAHQCGAGIETMLRVIVLGRVPRQAYRERIASCWDDIEGEARWDAAAGRLVVERTTYNPEYVHQRTVYSLTPEGIVEPAGVERLP